MKAKRDDMSGEPAACKMGRRAFLSATGGMAVALSSGVSVASGLGEGQNQRSNSRGVTKPLFAFAAAQVPRTELLFPSERWLSAVSQAGYTHVCLELDPFFHPESDRSDGDEDDIWMLGLFNMAAGPLSRSYRAWLGAVSEAVSRHGLRLGMELWEPQLPKYAQQILPADWKGPAVDRGGNEPLCVGQPAAREWFLENLESVLAAAPQMDALALGQQDNRAYLCNERCPRCGDRPIEERFSELYRDIAQTCRNVRGDFQFIPYDWWWPDEFYEATLKVIPKGSSVLTRLDKGAFYTPDPDHPEWSGHVVDVSLGCSQLGPVFTRAKNAAIAHGGSVLAMFTLSGMFEGSLLPYVPAVGKVAQKFQLMRENDVKGWVDYDNGGIHEGLILDLVSVVQHRPDASIDQWLYTLAQQRYGAGRCIESALAVWKSFDRAVEVFPQVLDFKTITDFSGRFDVGWLPMLPFIPERARIGRDLNGNDSGDPYDMLTSEAIPAVRHCLRKALEFAQEGLRVSQLLTSQVPPDSASKAKFDEAMAELTVLTWTSATNFYSWAAALQGDQSVPLKDVIRNEIEVTRRYRNLQIRPELEIGNMTWSWQREIAHCVPQASSDAYICSKLMSCSIPKEFPDAIGDFYAWKMAGLEKQLKSL